MSLCKKYKIPNGQNFEMDEIQNGQKSSIELNPRRWIQGRNVLGQGQGLQKKSEAKYRLFEDRLFWDQTQEWSRPKTKNTIFLNYSRQVFYSF